MSVCELIDKTKCGSFTLDCAPLFMEKGNLADEAQRHIHDSHQLTFVLRGSGTIIVNGIEQSVREGSVYLISRHCTHSLISKTGFEAASIFFYIDELTAQLHSLKEHPGFQSMFYLQPSWLSETNSLSNILQLDYEGIYYVNSLLKLLFEEASSDQAGNETIVQSYFIVLTVFLARQYGQINHVNKNVSSFYKITSYMNENYNKIITIEELLNLAKITNRQLRKMFNEEYGCSPMQYLIGIRINRACYLLAYSDTNITEIANSVGFDDSNYFSRKFKQIKGVSPRDYRAQVIQSTHQDSSSIHVN